MVSNAAETPLPPSVEEAYRRKCIDLKKRMEEVEQNNDAVRVRKARMNRTILKLRLERAYLLEMLGKRMKKSGAEVDLKTGFFFDESEGSSEGPPTPQERPLRTKRSHRQPAGSPSAPAEYTTSSQQRPQISFASSSYDQQPSHLQDPPSILPSQDIPPAEHASSSQPPVSQQVPIQQQQQPQQKPDILPSNLSPTHMQPLRRAPNPILSPIPPPDPFSMFFENKYLSQPHKHSGARTEQDLLNRAKEDWEKEEFKSQRSMYERQANKQRQVYIDSRDAIEMMDAPQPPLAPAADQQRGALGRAAAGNDDVEKKDGGEGSREGEDVEMKDAGASGGSGGFAAINR